MCSSLATAICMGFSRAALSLVQNGLRGRRRGAARCFQAAEPSSACVRLQQGVGLPLVQLGDLLFDVGQLEFRFHTLHGLANRHREFVAALGFPEVREDSFGQLACGPASPPATP